MVLPQRVRKYIPEKVVFQQDPEDEVGLFTIKKVREKNTSGFTVCLGIALVGVCEIHNV